MKHFLFLLLMISFMTTAKAIDFSKTWEENLESDKTAHLGCYESAANTKDLLYEIKIYSQLDLLYLDDAQFNIISAGSKYIALRHDDKRVRITLNRYTGEGKFERSEKVSDNKFKFISSVYCKKLKKLF